MSIILKGIDLPENDRYTTLRIYKNGHIWLGKTLVGVAIQIPKEGHWEQERIISVEDAQVSMLQLATCPNCKRIHTTPYRYCFEEYAYCPKCGAKMGGNEDER